MNLYHKSDNCHFVLTTHKDKFIKTMQNKHIVLLNIQCS